MYSFILMYWNYLPVAGITCNILNRLPVKIMLLLRILTNHNCMHYSRCILHSIEIKSLERKCFSWDFKRHYSLKYALDLVEKENLKITKRFKFIFVSKSFFLDSVFSVSYSGSISTHYMSLVSFFIP